MSRILSYEEVKKFYDRFGKKQDLQFYENRAIDDLVEHSDFEDAHSVFEFGCGTGRLAERLFRERFPEDCRYLGVDISTTMVELARKRLEPWKERAGVRLSKGPPVVDAPDQGFDRFLSTYVVEILSPEDARLLTSEARRALSHGGLLSIVSLTYGDRGLQRIMTWLWERVYSVRPQWLGGCRPVELLDYIDANKWRIRHHRTVTSFGISSEVLVAQK